MLISNGMNLVSASAVIGAWLESVDAAHIKVTVITKRRIATTLYEGRFQKYFKAGAGYVK